MMLYELDKVEKAALLGTTAGTGVTAMTTRTYTDELDCYMVEKPITCVQCDGKCVIKREVEVPTMNSGGFAEIEIECPNCKGEGQVFIEVCNNCQQSESECHCLDSVEQGVRAA